MTKEHCLAVAGLLAILVGAGFGVAMMLPRGPSVTKANFDRVQEGMTQAEVVAILGEPHNREYGDDKTIRTIRWMERDGFVGVHIDLENDSVTSKVWTKHPDEDLIEKFRRWLRL